MRRAALVSFAVAVAAIGAPWAGLSQTQAKGPQFEVAAIKPGNINHIGSLTSMKSGMYHMVNSPLKQWVEIGLSVQDYALKAPAWLDTTTFDLDARLPAGPPPTQQAVAEMMKSLLIERFGLKWHEETQTVSGYELVTDKKVLAPPANLVERMLGPGGASWGASGVTGTNMPMSRLAELLGTALGRPVVDATHLTGGYDIKVSWRPSDDAEVARRRQYGTDVDNLPGSAFTAVREQLGLRLQPARVPTKVVVVDQISRQPTAN